MKIERRTYALDNFKVERRAEGDDPPKIIGHAALFNSLSEEIYGFREQIAPGAFKNAVKEDDVRALFNHDPNIVLGRTGPGTLRLSEDSKGLAIEIDPPDTQQARDLMVSIERGDVSQMSFGFRVTSEEWEFKDGKEPDIRTLTEVQLFDVSPVTFPAYTDTDVSLRAMRDLHSEARKRYQKEQEEAVPPVPLERMKRQQALAECE